VGGDHVSEALESCFGTPQPWRIKGWRADAKGALGPVERKQNAEMFTAAEGRM